jgi:hypothetical protein
MALINNCIVLDRSRTVRMRLLEQVASTETPDPEQTHFVFVQLDIEKLALELWGRKRTLDAVLSRQLVVLPEERPPIHLEHVTEAEQGAVERRWTLVTTSLRDLGPRIYIDHARGALAREFASRKVASKPFFYTALRLYWQNGGGKTSLLTRRDQCGAPGESRVAQPGAPKRGRKRTIQPGVGLNVTAEHRRYMCITFHRAPIGRDGRHLRGAWHWMLLKYYPDHVNVEPTNKLSRDGDWRGVANRPLEELGPLKLTVQLPDAVPSFEQFCYHFHREFNYEQLQVKRKGARRAQKNAKALTTGTLIEVRASGSRYYIDATVIDDYVVSFFDRDLVVGRPTLYVVVDQKTRLIVGIYIGLEPPCWAGAMLALYNCCVDKVAFCATYGIPIEPGAWPTGFIPLHLMGDRAELMSEQASLLSTGFNLDVENATSYSGDAKGVVERVFRTLQAKFGPFLPGFVDKDAERGAAPPATGARLDLTELTRVVLTLVLQANSRIIRDFEADPELIVANVPTQPLAMWNWYASQMRTDYRRFDLDYVRRHLWPRHDLTLTKKALHFIRGIYYQGESLELQRWYAKSFATGASFQALYHPLYLQSMTVIASQEKAAEFEVAVTKRSARVMHQLSLSELKVLDVKKRRRNAAEQWDSTPHNARMDGILHETIRHAKKEYAEQHDPGLSPQARTKNIRGNRDAELQQMDVNVLISSGIISRPEGPSEPPVTAPSRTATRLREAVAARQNAAGGDPALPQT